MDTNTILKRLEVLKNVIALQDTDDIEFQAGKLQKTICAETNHDLTADIECIITLINRKAYGDAMQVISALLQRFNTIAKWNDPEIQGLQAEVKALSAQIGNLEGELSEIEKTIHEFEVRHTRELGEIVLKILHIKSRLAADKARQQPDDTTAQQEYEQAETEEHEYKGTYKETLEHPIQQLDPEQETELKAKFRMIVKLTHPDLVDKRYEKEATTLFIKAKKAKDENDINTIRQIYEYLETGKPFTLKEESIKESEALRSEAKHLRNIIAQLMDKINAIKNSETYITILKIENWDTYFAEVKVQLQGELEILERQMK